MELALFPHEVLLFSQDDLLREISEANARGRLRHVTASTKTLNRIRGIAVAVRRTVQQIKRSKIVTHERWGQMFRTGAILLCLGASSMAFAGGGYAAIAFDNTNGAWAEKHGAYSLEEAERAALNACRSSGCTIVGWVRNGYIAMANGHGGWGVQSSTSRQTAIDRAMESCNREAYTPCKLTVVTWAFE